MAKIDGRALDHTTTEHLREQAVRRVREDGEKPSTVIHSMGLCRTTIYRWLRAYDKGGFAALKSTKACGPEPKLDEKQRQKVRRWIVGKDPRQYGFDFGLWTRRIVAELIKDKFGIDLELTAVGRLLASLDITPQKPLRRAYERDPEKVEQWVKHDYPKLRKRARKLGATIFFLDEAGFSSEPILGRRTRVSLAGGDPPPRLGRAKRAKSFLIENWPGQSGNRSGGWLIVHHHMFSRRRPWVIFRQPFGALFPLETLRHRLLFPANKLIGTWP